MGHYVNEKALRYQEYITREENIRHHTYREERTQFELLRAGDPRALDARRKASRENQPGRVSLDPLRNLKYLTVTPSPLPAAPLSREAWTKSAPMTSAICIFKKWT